MTIFVIATVWNSLVAWLLIGVVVLLGFFFTGLWGFDWQWAGFLWIAVLVLGYLKIWEESV